MRAKILGTILLALAATGLMVRPLSAMPQGAVTTARQPFQLKVVRAIAIQSGGRLKPLDTFASQTVSLITGESSFKGQDPILTILRWNADPAAARKQAVVEVRNLAIKRELGLNVKTRWFSYDQLINNQQLSNMQEHITALSQAGARLKGQDRAKATVLNRLSALQQVLDGSSLDIIPNPAGLKHSWASVQELEAGSSGLDQAKAQAIDQTYNSLLSALESNNAAAFNQQADALSKELHAAGPYPEQRLLNLEIEYNHMHPFRLAWIFYLCGALLLLIPGVRAYWLGVVGTLAGFAMHGYGFYLRVVIADRAPVTNMYESVVWAAFGVVLFALVLGLRRKSRTVLVSADAVAVLALILADSLPAVLDPSIKPLAPVLRNNFWLTTHVLTITLGYAAFMLSLGLGHVILCKKAAKPDRDTKELDKALYRSLQVGVLFLAAGTILGGVWANYSWGKFWGWDPKEVWALIALLSYLALLHGRYCGWFRSFETAIGAVVGFLGVLMAWYGVNFVLGAGMHSYGFGTGGVGYVIFFVVVDLLFVGAMSWMFYSKRRK